jgi:hypothetical protein
MPTATKKRLTTKDLVNRILRLVTEGRIDSHLETIALVVRERQRIIRDQRATMNMAELSEPGTKVRITRGVKPQYLAGLEGTVVERPMAFFRNKPGTIYVDLGRKVRRYGPIVGCPASALEAA